MPDAGQPADSGHRSDDLTLLARTAAGDRRAFAVFVRRHQSGVWRYLRLRAGGDAAAEDALQETFLRALEAAGTFRGGEATTARAWLLVIARHVLGRHGRLRAGEPERIESLDELGVRAGWGADDAPTPEAAASAGEERALLERALARLGALDREVLLARDVEGHSAAEVAASCELSVAAVKSRLHRARLRLMAALRAESDSTEVSQPRGAADATA